MKNTSIFIVEDHQLLRETWNLIINAEPGFAVVGHAATGEEALKMADLLRPDIIMMDINLPGLSGIDTTKLILKKLPSTRIVAVSFLNNLSYVRAMLKAGASGYLTKNASTRELIKAFEEILEGKHYVSSEIKEMLSNELMDPEAKEKQLSFREMEVIALLKKGHSSKEIAGQLFLSVKTVEVHRSNILRKLGLKNTAALVDYIHRRMP
ncbi:MAG: response regulator [Flavisolibacter sp.]